ncbi:MAG: PQQ-binding-like beta-propeller repeat protein [Polyangiaceae bacterium]
MSVLVSAQCSNCGAHLQLENGTTSVACPYCGKTFLVRSAPPAPEPPAPRFRPSNVPQRSSKSSGSVLAKSFLVALVVGGLVAIVGHLTRQENAATPVKGPAIEAAKPASPTPTHAAQTPTKPADSIEFDADRPLLFANVNGDAWLDPLLLATVKTDRDRFAAYAALDGKTGELLWKTAALGGNASSTRATVAYDRLITVDDSGQLTGFDIANGRQQWTTALGERWYAFCSAKEPATVNVITVDERSIAVDVKTGKQGGITKARVCNSAPFDRTVNEWDNPRDRRDRHAPAGIKSLRCGSTRVMGSENYVVPDACAATTHVDSDDMDGVNASALWYLPTGLLVLGVKTPGSRIPMLGLWSRGKFTWKVEVPEGNPLDCDEGSTGLTTLNDDRVITIYTNKKRETATLTSFALTGGQRLWSSTIPKAVGRPRLLTLESGQLWLEVDGSPKDAILVFDVQDGRLRFGIASGESGVLTTLPSTP